MAKVDINEFYSLVDEYINHQKVLEMKEYIHHGIRRYDHCFRVAYHTYKVTKVLGLNYQSATKAAMLHDFFTDELENKKKIVRFRRHPKVAAENAKKYFGLTEMEEDIIVRHMFPITFTPPKYLESWIVDLVDDIVSAYEKCYSAKKNMQSLANLIAILLISIVR